MTEPASTCAWGPTDGPGSGRVMSWVNTPMSRLLVGAGRGLRLRWSSVSLRHWKMAFQFRNASDLIAFVPNSENKHFVVHNHKAVKGKLI